MHIKKIKINNYRNYNEAEISFHEKMNILYGDNAQGKTNILESIYICATTKSHQGSKDKEIIKMGCDEAHVKMYIEKEGLEHYIDLHLKKNKPKGIAVNGIPIKRSAELMGIINIVLFFAGCKKMMKILNTELNKKYSKTTVFLVYLVFLFNFISIVIH